MLDPEYYAVFEVWQKFNAGFGLPGGKPWDEYDPFLIDVLVSIENYHRSRYSLESVRVNQMQSMLEMYVKVHSKK